MAKKRKSKIKTDPTFRWIIITVAVTLITVILFIYDIMNNSSGSVRMGKYAVTIGTAAASAYKLISERKAQKNSISSAFADKIGTAFKSDKKLNRLLHSALDDYANDNYTECIKKFTQLKEKAVTAEERRVVRFFTASCFKNTGNSNYAVTLYTELLAEYPEYAPALSNLSVIYAEKGDYRTAIAFAERALQSDRNNPFAYTNLAASYLQISETEKAKLYAQKALEIKNNLRAAVSLLAIIYTLESDEQSAKKYTYRAIALGQSPDGLKASIENYKQLFAHKSDTELRVKKWIERTGLPSIHFTLDGDSGKSIIGGLINEPAPVSEDGEKMRLLAAVFCSELPDNNLFPKHGVIRIYITPNDYFGADFDHFDKLNIQKNFRVLFDSDESVFVTSLYNEESEMFPVSGSYRPRFYSAVDAMTPEDYRFNSTVSEILTDDETQDDYWDDDFIAKISSSGHKMGGYPTFTQTDPREDDINYAQYDTQLFQLDSDFSSDSCKVMFGDAGVANFLISSEKLKNCDFSDVLYTWDCY